ncbi:hypothetical protein Vafri_15450, partial [Volvox africanus]
MPSRSSGSKLVILVIFILLSPLSSRVAFFSSNSSFALAQQQAAGPKSQASPTSSPSPSPSPAALPPPELPPVSSSATIGLNATVTSAAEVQGLLSGLKSAVVTLFVTSDLFFNATTWPDPIDWPPLPVRSKGDLKDYKNTNRGPSSSSLWSSSSSSSAGDKPTFVLTFIGQPVPISDNSNNSISTTRETNVDVASGSSSNEVNSNAKTAPSKQQQQRVSPVSTSSYRLPRLDLANMQGRLHLAAGAMLVLKNLEISGTT